MIEFDGSKELMKKDELIGVEDSKEPVTTRVVRSADLQENFALRDEIKQLRLLITGMVIARGGRCYIRKKHFEKINAGDTFTQTEDLKNDRIILTFEGK